MTLDNLTFSTYEELKGKFKWNIPKYFNIGDAILDRKIREGYGDNIAVY
ncbi:hypothetical protein V6M85_02485 [Sulfolobus tengchongensis]|uniref:Uncharacterized protein n=1 Tax=Sulfolobus tengchongensis TaxID=207809 RepID=A0AAX4L241_9CREN